jgi:hypothetical protein
MNNTSYLSSLIDFMREATRTPDPIFANKFGIVYDWCDRSSKEIDRTILGFTVDELCELCDATFGEGANCQAFVLADGVVKWETGRGYHDNADSDTAVRIYREAVERGYGDNFARTESFGNITVQERIIPYNDVMYGLTLDHCADVESQIRQLGRMMNIGDLHEYNWGFRPDDDACVTPVIFDFSAEDDHDTTDSSDDTESSAW